MGNSCCAKRGKDGSIITSGATNSGTLSNSELLKINDTIGGAFKENQGANFVVLNISKD